jgi:hypothetical protein
VFSAGVIGGAEANWMKSRKHGGELIMKERMSKQQLVITLRERSTNPDTTVPFSAGPRGNFVFAKYNARTPLLSVETLHIGDVKTAADIQEFFAGCGYCFVFDGDWDDAERKSKLVRAEETWLAEFKAVGEDAKAKLQKEKEKTETGKKRKRGGKVEVVSDTDSSSNDPKAMNRPSCDATSLLVGQLSDHLHQVHRMGSDSDDVDKSPEITFVKESFSSRSSKVAVHPSLGKVSPKSQVKVKREMKRESDPEPTEHEYDERQDFCSRLSILIKANDAAFTYFKEGLARFESNETHSIGGFGQLGAGPSDSGLNYAAGSVEDQYLVSNPAQLSAPPFSALDPTVASLNDYSHLMSDQYLVNDATVGLQPATDSGLQHHEYQFRHHPQPQTVQTVDVLVDNSEQEGVGMENPSWGDLSAAGFSASLAAAPGIERDSAGEGFPGDGGSKPPASEMVSEQCWRLAIRSRAVSSASGPRQCMRPFRLSRSLRGKPEEVAPDCSMAIYYSFESLMAPTAFNVFVAHVSATASAGSGTPAQMSAARPAARPRGKGKK